MLKLEPQYDSRKSFYGKAKYEVIEKENNKRLFKLHSYGTLVATVEEGDGKMSCTHLGRFSQTTSRHQREFFKQMGLNDIKIKFLEAHTDEVIDFEQGY